MPILPTRPYNKMTGDLFRHSIGQAGLPVSPSDVLDLFEGGIADLARGLIGHLTDRADQSSLARKRAFVSDCSAETSQIALQDNRLKVAGDPSFSLDFDGRPKGTVRGVEVDPVTDAVSQSNRADLRISIGGEGPQPVTAEQADAQVNRIKAVGDAAFTIAGDGVFKGIVCDIEVGLITGEVAQQNHAGQRISSDDGGSSEAIQSVCQDNALEALGDVSFHVIAGGLLTGTIRNVEVGLLTGSVEQCNHADQEASLGNGSESATALSSGQSASQANWIAVAGDVAFTLDVGGAFSGVIEGIEIGLVTADIRQSNLAGQLASLSGAGETQADQRVLQENGVEVTGDLSFSIVVEGDFTGRIQDVKVGLLQGEVGQLNDSRQVASAEDPATIEQTALQENWLEALDDIDISLIFTGTFSGDLQNLTIGLTPVDVEQSNFLVQRASDDPAGIASESLPDLSRFMTRSHSVGEDGRIDLDVAIVIGAEFADDFSDLIIGVEVMDLIRAAAAPVWT